jgi:Ca-activated chloride channel family protein
MFGFEYPELFLLLPFLFYCFYRCREKPKQRYFVHLELFSHHELRVDKRLWLKFLTVFFLITALSSPVTVNPYDPKNRQGIAMVLTLDASGSMNARGYDEDKRSLSKFDIVKEIVQDFIKERLEDNIGIVLFGDFAFIATPLTYEKEALSHMVSYLGLGMAGENTAIGDGIYESLVTLESSKAKSKVIVLLTDGMHNAGQTSPKRAVAMAVDRGVKIYTIGMGTESHYNKTMLEKIASDSKGQFFKAENREALEEVYSEIDDLERSKIRSRDYLYKDYWYAIPLALALLFFMLYWRRRLGSLR